MLKKGDRGDTVRRLQEDLMLLGCKLPRWGADGSLGDETLQAAHSLLVAKNGPPAIDGDMSSISDSELAYIEDMVTHKPLHYFIKSDWDIHKIISEVKKVFAVKP